MVCIATCPGLQGEACCGGGGGAACSACTRWQQLPLGRCWARTGDRPGCPTVSKSLRMARPSLGALWGTAPESSCARAVVTRAAAWAGARVPGLVRPGRALGPPVRHVLPAARPVRHGGALALGGAVQADARGASQVLGSHRSRCCSVAQRACRALHGRRGAAPWLQARICQHLPLHMHVRRRGPASTCPRLSRSLLLPLAAAPPAAQACARRPRRFRAACAQLFERLWRPDQEHAASLRFTCWLQWHLHRQLSHVSAYAAQRRVILKGDLPIGARGRASCGCAVERGRRTPASSSAEGPGHPACSGRGVLRQPPKDAGLHRLLLDAPPCAQAEAPLLAAPRAHQAPGVPVSGAPAVCASATGPTLPSAAGVDKRSVDTWMRPAEFRMTVSTGAPPDYFDASGQNWGFPTYDWEAMAENGYEWWRARLAGLAQCAPGIITSQGGPWLVPAHVRPACLPACLPHLQAGTLCSGPGAGSGASASAARAAHKRGPLQRRYFHAYRIDHILGFFRIWEIPGNCVTGLLGHFRPSVPISRAELDSRGIWDIDRRARTRLAPCACACAQDTSSPHNQLIVFKLPAAVPPCPRPATMCKAVAPLAEQRPRTAGCPRAASGPTTPTAGASRTSAPSETAGEGCAAGAGCASPTSPTASCGRPLARTAWAARTRTSRWGRTGAMPSAQATTGGSQLGLGSRVPWCSAHSPHCKESPAAADSVPCGGSPGCWCLCCTPSRSAQPGDERQVWALADRRLHTAASSRRRVRARAPASWTPQSEAAVAQRAEAAGH